MEFKFLFLSILVASLKITMAQKYCDESLCGSRQHIACNNNGQFASRCVNATLITLTKEHKDSIVREFNNIRNRVAGGEGLLLPACRMATMQWDEELAQLAALNVKQCQIKHDSCRNTNAFRQAGQNIVLMTYQGTLQIPQRMLKGINIWLRQLENIQMPHVMSFPKSYSGPSIGHLALMITDRNIRVGCAASNYRGNNNVLTFLMTCNYATTNVINRPIYTSCLVPGLECLAGTNPAHPNLCSTSEQHVVNL